LTRLPFFDAVMGQISKQFFFWKEKLFGLMLLAKESFRDLQ
jgi:hypothetical protein